MKYLTVILILPLLACGVLAPTATPNRVGGFNHKVVATKTSPCYVVLVDTLTLRKGPAESFAAWDGMELHAGDTFSGKPVWNERGELWIIISPVEAVAAQIGEKIFIGACQ